MPIDFSRLDDRNRSTGFPIQPDSYRGPEPDGSGRRDRYAEFLVGKGYYRDRGCSLQPSCLECPLNECRYDGNGYYDDIRERDTKIAARVAFRKPKKPGDRIRKVAVEYNLSTRTVHRIVQRARKRNAVELE